MIILVDVRKLKEINDQIEYFTELIKKDNEELIRLKKELKEILHER